MAFRDDRDALRARAESAQRELADAKRRLAAVEERARHHERKDVDDERELTRLRAEVARLGGVASGEGVKQAAGLGRVAWSMLSLAMFSMVVIASASWFVVRSSGDAEPLEPAGMPTSPRSEPAALLPPPTPHTPLDRARFGAVVISADGIDLQPGDGCVVDAARPAGEIEVRCAQHVLFAGKGRELSYSAVGVEGSGEMRDALSMSDDGDGEAQFHLATPAHALRVWTREWDIHLRVAPLGAVRASAESNRLVGPVGSRVWRATLERPDPTAPPHGDHCVLERYPSSQPSCRFLLVCGGDILYGAAEMGYAPCTADTAYDSSFSDGDPAFRLDANRFVLEGETEEGVWRETYALETDDRCNLSGRWIGHWRHADGRVADGVTFDTGRLTLTTGLGVVGLFMHATLDCESGAVALSGTDDEYTGHFGPEFATVLLRSEDALLELIRVGG